MELFTASNRPPSNPGIYVVCQLCISSNNYTTQQTTTTPEFSLQPARPGFQRPMWLAAACNAAEASNHHAKETALASRTASAPCRAKYTCNRRNGTEAKTIGEGAVNSVPISSNIRRIQTPAQTLSSDPLMSSFRFFWQHPESRYCSKVAQAILRGNWGSVG